MMLFRFKPHQEASFIHERLPSSAPAAQFADMARSRRDVLRVGKSLCYAGALAMAVFTGGHAWHARYDLAGSGGIFAGTLALAGRARKAGIAFHQGLEQAAQGGVPQARAYLRTAMQQGKAPKAD